MKLSLRNEGGRVRDGWKAVFFILAAMACFVVTGLVGHRLPASWRPFAPSAILATVLALAITWGAARLEGTTLAAVGLRFDGRFLRQWIAGIVVGAAMILASAAAVCAVAGVRLEPAAGPTLAMELKLVAMFLGGAIFEEVLFRGFAFQRAMRGMGTLPAICVFGVLFCLAHMPGNLDIGAGLLATAMANLFADAIFQSVLFLRTRSLALPIGLHFGWNLVQASLGFGVSGISHTDAWFHVSLGNAPGWLTGGEFGLEASIVALGLQVALIAMTLKSTPRSSPELRGRPA
jgi:membrane protease YdiL (CAAX protease family)